MGVSTTAKEIQKNEELLGGLIRHNEDFHHGSSTK
jgi:hypothetical protein